MEILRSILIGYLLAQVVVCYICFVIRYFLLVINENKVSGFFILVALMPIAHALVVTKHAFKLYKQEKEKINGRVEK